MANKVVSITVDVEKATEMMDFYRAYQKVNDGEYIIFQAYYSGTTITIYQDKKFFILFGYFFVVFKRFYIIIINIFKIALHLNVIKNKILTLQEFLKCFVLIAESPCLF